MGIENMLFFVAGGILVAACAAFFLARSKQHDRSARNLKNESAGKEGDLNKKNAVGKEIIGRLKAAPKEVKQTGEQPLDQVTPSSSGASLSDQIRKKIIDHEAGKN